jgi:acetylornithine deacetylase
MYGAGDVNVAHAPEKHTSVPDLMTATKTVALLIAEWCGVVE